MASQQHSIMKSVFAFLLLFQSAVGVAQQPDVLFCSSFEQADCVVPDTQGPLILDPLPSSAIIDPSSEVSVGAKLVDAQSGIDAATIRLDLDGVDITSLATIADGVVSYVPATPFAAGRHEVAIRAADNEGNENELQWSFRISTDPEISQVGPDEIEVDNDAVEIAVDFLDPGEDIDLSSISLKIGDVDVSAELTPIMTTPRSGAVRFTPDPPLPAGRHRLSFSVANLQGAFIQRTWGFWVREPSSYVVDVLAPADELQVHAPELRAATRVYSNRAMPLTVLINDEATRLESDEGAQYAFFYRDILLRPGRNTVRFSAAFSDGEIRTVERIVNYVAPPQVTVTTPADWTVFGPAAVGLPGAARNLTGMVERPIAIEGIVDTPVISVMVNQQSAEVLADGLHFRFPQFFLHEGTNLVTVSATNADGRVGTTSVTLYVDQTAPLLAIEAPLPDHVTSEAKLDLRGIVNDAVEAAVHASEPSILVRNLANAAEVSGLVSDRYFVAQDIPLEVGANTLEIIATDGAQNQRAQTVRVVRIAAGSSRLTRLAGDRQSGAVGAELPQGLTAVALDAQGEPMVGHPVQFDVLRGTGSIGLQQGQATLVDGISPARNLTVVTDHAGRAAVWLTLGSEASPAGNVVRATGEGMLEEVVFTASGQRGQPAIVLIEGPGTQFAQSNSEPLDPPTVTVYDAQFNRVINTPVRFEVVAGDAWFTDRSGINAVVSADGRSIEVPTDKNGVASVRPRIGASPGVALIHASALASVGEAIAAGFQIQVVPPSDEPTRFGGNVLDHNGTPLAGVQLSIGRTSLSVSSDAQGRFSFEGQVPVGKIDLFVDGRDVATTPGTEYPALHFETTVVGGIDNQLPHPIYLPPVNLSSARVVGGNEDVVLTIAGYEGFEMVVKANSVTFPDGSRVGPLVVTPVNNDRLPMVPPGGGAGFGTLGWTLQPTGTRFDPPITVKIPNPGGMRAGETATIVQWDHDLATFVPMARATVSEDGSQLVSDPGSGLTKAGWGGCAGPDCPPAPPNCGSNGDEPWQPEGEIRTYELRRHFFSLFEWAHRVEPDNISKFYPTQFNLRSSPSGCETIGYRWTFGDGGVGFGEEVQHQYEERGERNVKVNVDCGYRGCGAALNNKVFPYNQDIFVRDTAWIEYREAMEECDWATSCFLKYQAQQTLSGIGEFLNDFQVDWLEDWQTWNSERLKELGRDNANSDGMLATLGILYALNEAVFPTSALDVIPVGKAQKATVILRRDHNISPDEVADFSKQITCIWGSARRDGDSPSSVPCPRGDIPYYTLFELAGIRRAISRLPPGSTVLKQWQPKIGAGDNGLDGAVLWKDQAGRLQLWITESKCWSEMSGVCPLNKFTALGLNNPATLDRNLAQVLADAAPNLSPDELLELQTLVQRRQIVAIIHTLGENTVDQATVSAGLWEQGIRVLYDVDPRWNR